MTLNEIELPAFVLANFYRDTLIIAPAENDISPAPVNEPQVKHDKADTKAMGFAGNNRQHILVIVDHKEVPVIPDHELELLTGILNACKLGIDDIALVNRNTLPEQTYKDYNELYRSRIILLFDAPPGSIGLPMNFPYFQPQSFNGSTYLFSPSLQELGNDKILKSKLWLCLKKIFSL